MSIRKELKKQLLEVLKKKFGELGYKLNLKNEFMKDTDWGWFKFQLIFLKLSTGGWLIKPAVQVRFHIVENIFHRTSGFELKYQKDTPTVGTKLEDFISRGKYAFELHKIDDVSEISRQLFESFLEIALPFFEKYSSLESLQAEINGDFNNLHLTGPIFKGYKGIILAKLLRCENLDEIVEVYMGYYKKFADGFYLPEFVNLVQDIENF